MYSYQNYMHLFQDLSNKPDSKSSDVNGVIKSVSSSQHSKSTEVTSLSMEDEEAEESDGKVFSIQ